MASSVAEAVGVAQQTIKDWSDGFTESPEDGLSVFPPGFTPPIYNVWQLHLSCLSQRQITDTTGTPQKTVADWVSERSQLTIFAQPPSRTDANPWGSIQHFDVWSFASDAGRKLADLSRVLAPAQEETVAA